MQKRCIVGALLALSFGSAKADLYEYTYTGEPFNKFNSYTVTLPIPSPTPIVIAGTQEYTSADHITYSFESSVVLAPNQTYEDYSTGNADPDTSIFGPWQITDGSNKISNTTLGGEGATYNIFLTTNSAGQIQSWTIDVSQMIGAGFLAISSDGSLAGSGGDEASVSYILSPNFNSSLQLYNAISTTAGAWTGPVDITSVSEPPSIVLFGAGLISLLAFSARMNRGKRRLPI